MKALMAFVVLLWAAASFSAPLGTSIVYQGELQQLGAPANGSFDFQVNIFDVNTGGVAIGNEVLLEDIDVTGGVFILDLDFGIAPFAGDQLWLEVGVREGASTDAHTSLLPRQKITAAPYALHAEMIALGAVGSGEVNPNQVQLRVGSSCAAGASIRAIDPTGTVVCESDDVGLTTVTGNEIVDGSISAADLATAAVEGNAIADGAVGTIQLLDGSIGAADLAAGAVASVQVLDDSIAASDLAANAVGASELADDAVDSAAIAPGAVGGSDIDASQVQIRVSGSCTAGTFLAGIGADGSVVCDPLPIGLTFAPAGDEHIQFDTRIAIRQNGLPIVGYSVSPSMLKVLDCENSECSSGSTHTLVQDAAESIDIAIRANGLPILSYFEQYTRRQSNP